MADKTKTGMSQLAQQIKWAAQNSGGSGLAGMAAMMGLPFQQKRGNQWMTIDPRMQSIYASGTTPYRAANQPKTGGELPPDDPFKNSSIGDWWKEWYRTQGQYGGVPPVKGLL